jgi:hypothetical protein
MPARDLIIPALVHRHAGDAAFYWQQHDGSAHSPLVGLPQLAEFDRLLDAHLDGLWVAGEPGWEIAMVRLHGVSQRRAAGLVWCQVDGM